MELPQNLENQESFESFKTRLRALFDAEGLSDSLKAEIERWHTRKQEETDRPGGTIRDRVIFQMELAKVYIVTDRFDFALETLEDARTEAFQGQEYDLEEEIDTLIYETKVNG